MAKKIKVGVAGQGRSGFAIHVDTMKDLPELFEVVAVADPIEERRGDVKKYFPGCRGYRTAEELIEDKEVELLVVATPNYLHTSHVQAGLRAGKGVLGEKPFALTLKDFDQTVAVAKKHGAFLAPFQQRRYEPTLGKIQELIAAGTIGEVVWARVSLRTFMRRWDWQTLKAFGGGQLHNNAPHIIDMALQLFGPGEPREICCDLQRTLATGDAEDHVKIMLKGPGHPTVEIELMQTDPFAEGELWRVQGTAGGVRGSAKSVEWKYVDWSEHPTRPVDPHPTAGRKYNSEPLKWKEGTWEVPKEYEGNNVAFYKGLYGSFREGKPLRVTLPEIRRQVGVIEYCRKACPV
jgi:predicted dehydrogenase